jgi:Uma2 family endonuclease
MSTAAKIMTAEELLRLPDDGYRYELIEGELRKMTPPGYEHGIVGQSLAWRLAAFVHQHQLGHVPLAETGFLIGHDPDTVRAPDVSFVSMTQVQRCGLPVSYFPEAPALAVEVVSPDDTAEEVDSKIRQWLAAGTKLAWVVYPRGRTVTVYRSLEDIRVLTDKDQLDGEDVVHGFQCQVADIFVSP